MNKDWPSLSYFEPLCRKVFDQYFMQRGFINSKADKTGCAYFMNDIFLRVHYYLEDSPKFSPMVTIGFVKKQPNSSVESESIGLWYAVPETIEARNYESWIFSNVEELEKSLIRLRDEVVDIYAKFLWEHPLELRRLVDKLKEEVRKRYNAEIMEKKKKDAESAFRNKNYQEALKIYDEIDVSYLSPAELKRIELSRKYIRKRK